MMPSAPEYLVNFNSWWRGDSDHYRAAANLLERLKVRYPHCPLAPEARKFAGVFEADDAQEAQEAQFDREYAKIAGMGMRGRKEWAR